MEVIIVGASGRIGSKVADTLSAKHEVVRVGARSGDVVCDYTDASAVQSMFEQIGSFDALIAVAGRDSVFKRYQGYVQDTCNR